MYVTVTVYTNILYKMSHFGMKDIQGTYMILLYTFAFKQTVTNIRLWEC